MEFTKEFIEKNQLNETQVTAITTEATGQEADLKKQWDGKANADAEGIIEGALKKTVDLTGIARNEGEKSADYLNRANGLYFEGTKNELERQKVELQDKIKNSKGDEVLKQELVDTKLKLDGLKQKEAQFADWETNDYKGKWEKANEQLTNQTKDIAFNSVKPSFPDTVNKYESKGRWNEFIKDTLNTHIIKKDGDDWIAVDKENEYKITKLSKLVEANEALQELAKGRDQKGLKSTQKDVKIEGLPFTLPENATSKDRNKAIKEYLATKYKSNMEQGYSEEFSKLNQIALGLGKKPEEK